MNKFYFVIFLLGIFVNSLYSQSIDRTLIATAGGNAQIGDFYYDWSVGESVIETIHNDEIIISEGFHQPAGIVMPLYKIEGNILAGGMPYTNASVYLCNSDQVEISPSIFNCNSIDGVFSFSFVPEDNYLLYAVPLLSDDYLLTYYSHTTNKENAFVLELNANIGGLDLQLVSKYDELEENVDPNIDEYLVYPTIFTNKIFVKAGNKNQSEYKLSIRSISGSTILTKEFHSEEEQEINLAQISSGTYLISIEGNNTIFSSLIFKVK